MEKYLGESFLSRLYRDMHTNKEVEKYSNKSDSKYEKIRKYLEKLEDVHEIVYKKDKIGLLKEFYYDKYIIKKENISDDYFKYLEENALNRGLGHIRYNKGILDREKDVIINDQKKSLDNWIDYFISEDSKMYPTWFKYYVFQSVIKLGSFNKEKNTYNQRNEYTVSIFPELNREAIAIMYDYFNNFLNGKKDFNDKELEKLINGGSFKKIYTYIIKSLKNYKKQNIQTTEGVWIKYPMGDDYLPLVKSLEGKGTGWCTAGWSTAKEQLAGGDFYVYYTYDTDGKPTMPRIAIRMEEDNIAEIRGIEKNQNLEPEMEIIVQEKLKEFPDGNLYNKKISDMEKLTKIYIKYKENNVNYSVEELKFLYQFESKIEGFGYTTDPRIDEILKNRDKKIDISKILNCSIDKIILKKDKTKELTLEELSKNEIMYYEGNIMINNLTSYIKLPKYIDGDLIINTEKIEMELPEYISGSLCMNDLKTLEGIKLPKFIGEDLEISNIKNIENYTFPEIIYGALMLHRVVSMKNVILPKTIYKNCGLSSIKNIENVTMPSLVKNYFSMENLEEARNLKLPDFVGSLSMGRLKNVYEVKFPKKIRTFIDLRNLKTAIKTIFPEEVNGLLNLKSLEEFSEITLSKKVKDLVLDSLKTVNDIELPEVKNNLYLQGLETIEGLILPDDFDLNNLYIKEELKKELLEIKKL